MGCLRLTYQEKEVGSNFLTLEKKNARAKKSDNYYAFGLQTSQSWTRIDTKPNQYLYNGGAELNEVTGNYDLFFRGYDPVLGRMNGVDPEADFYASQTPYNYGFNDPVYWNDPMGDDPASSERGGYSWASMGGCGCWRDVGPQDAHAGPGADGGMYGASWSYYTYGSSSVGGSAFAKINVDVHLNAAYYGAMYAAAEQARNEGAEGVANYAATYGNELLWGFGQMPNLQTGEEFTGNIYLYLYDGESGSSSIDLYWQAPYKPTIYDLAPDSWIPVYGDIQRANYWAGHGDWSRVALYGASAALDVAGIAGITRALVKTGARLLARNTHQIFRVVSKAEASDILANGFRSQLGSYEGKLFWSNMDDARWFQNWAGAENSILKINVSNTFIYENGYDAGRLFYYVSPDRMRTLNSATKGVKILN